MQILYIFLKISQKMYNAGLGLQLLIARNRRLTLWIISVIISKTLKALQMLDDWVLPEVVQELEKQEIWMIKRKIGKL